MERNCYFCNKLFFCRAGGYEITVHITDWADLKVHLCPECGSGVGNNFKVNETEIKDRIHEELEYTV